MNSTTRLSTGLSGNLVRPTLCANRLLLSMSLLRKGPRGGGATARPTRPPPAAPTGTAATPSELWCEKYAPSTREDLAMHPQKVAEVSKWLQTADVSLQLRLPPSPRLLVLTGPPGTGKSTMLRVLAAESAFEICEWVEPRSQPRDFAWSQTDGNHEEPRAQAFPTFLHDSLRTVPLSVAPATSATGRPAGADWRRRLVLIDDLDVSGDERKDTANQHIVRSRRSHSRAQPHPRGGARSPSPGPLPPYVCALVDASLVHASLVHAPWQEHIRRALAWARFPIALVLSSEGSSNLHNLVETLRGPDAHSHSLVCHIQVCESRAPAGPRGRAPGRCRSLALAATRARARQPGCARRRCRGPRTASIAYARAPRVDMCMCICPRARVDMCMCMPARRSTPWRTRSCCARCSTSVRRRASPSRVRTWRA